MDVYTSSVDECVDGCIRSLGRKQMIYGSAKHEILGFWLEVGQLLFGQEFSRWMVYDVFMVMVNKIMGVRQEDFYSIKKK